MLHRILLAIASAPLIVALTWLALPADASPQPPSWVPAGITKPCPVEDAAGPCYWDAKHRGNGRGENFYVTKHQYVGYPDRHYCQYDVYRGEIGVIAWPGAHVTVRAHGAVKRGKVPRGSRYVTFRTRRSYTQDDVRAWAGGHRCEGT